MLPQQSTITPTTTPWQYHHHTNSTIQQSNVAATIQYDIDHHTMATPLKQSTHPNNPIVNHPTIKCRSNNPTQLSNNQMSRQQSSMTSITTPTPTMQQWNVIPTIHYHSIHHTMIMSSQQSTIIMLNTPPQYHSNLQKSKLRTRCTGTAINLVGEAEAKEVNQATIELVNECKEMRMSKRWNDFFWTDWRKTPIKLTLKLESNW